MSENAGPSNEPVQVFVINQFKEVCDVDTVIARSFLEESGWNLEAAIHQYFHSNDPEAIENQDNQLQETQELRHRQQAQTSSSSIRTALLSTSNVVQAQQPAGWLQFVRSLFVVPLQFCYSSMTKVFVFLYVLLFNPHPAVGRPRQNRAIREEPPVVNFDRLLMRQQEEEYAKSLAADKAKRDQRVREELRRQDEEKRAKDEATRLEDKKHQFDAKRSEIRAQQSSEPSSGNDLVCIKMKFPGGAIYNRKFHEDDKLEELFNAVIIQDSCPQDFALLTGHPAIALNCFPEWYREFGTVKDPENIPTFKEVGLQKTAVVLVRDNES